MRGRPRGTDSWGRHEGTGRHGRGKRGHGGGAEERNCGEERRSEELNCGEVRGLEGQEWGRAMRVAFRMEGRYSWCGLEGGDRPATLRL